jgi:hypothetical protein
MVCSPYDESIEIATCGRHIRCIIGDIFQSSHSAKVYKVLRDGRLTPKPNPYFTEPELNWFRMETARKIQLGTHVLPSRPSTIQLIQDIEAVKVVRRAQAGIYSADAEMSRALALLSHARAIAEADAEAGIFSEDAEMARATAEEAEMARATAEAGIYSADAEMSSELALLSRATDLNAIIVRSYENFRAGEAGRQRRPPPPPPRYPQADAEIYRAVISRESREANRPSAGPAGPLLDDIGQEEETHECTICLVDVDATNGVKLRGCVHVYHRECITKWYYSGYSQKRCPLCRTAM